MINFIKKYKKQYIVIAILCFFAMLFLLINGRSVTSYFEMQDDYQSVTLEEINPSNIVGYSVDGNTLEAIEDIFYVEIGKIGTPIKSVELVLDKQLGVGDSVKLYYDQENTAFNEFKTIDYMLMESSKRVVVDIPVDDAQNIRFCIPGKSYVKEIHLGREHAAAIVKEKSTLYVGPFCVFAFFVSLFVAGIVLKIAEFIKGLKCPVEPKVILKRGLILFFSMCFVVGAGLVAEKLGLFMFDFSRALFLAVFVVFAWSFFWLRKSWAEKPERLFALITLTTGFLTTILMPTLMERTWDVAVHFQKVYSMACIWESSYNYMDVGHYLMSYNYREMIELFGKYTSQFVVSPLVEHSFDIRNVYGHFGYIPSAVGIFITKGLGISFIGGIWLGRTLTLLLYTFVISFAIKRIKSGKLIMAVIALYPTCVMLASNVTYDPWTISLTMLGFSYLANIVTSTDEKLNTREYITMLLIFIIGMGSKPVYFPMILLALFIPFGKFINKKKQFVYYGTVIISALVVVLLMLVPMLSGPGGDAGVSLAISADLRGGFSPDPAAQLQYIASNPGTYANNILMFLKFFWSIPNSSEYMVRLGYMGIVPLHYLVLGLVIAVILTDKTGYCKVKCNIGFRILTIICMFGTSALVATVFYLVYTGVGQIGVAGCQPRYLLPLLFPFAWALRNNFIDLKIKRSVYTAVVMGVAAFPIWFGVFNVMLLGRFYQ